jgi:hypothetical protein
LSFQSVGCGGGGKEIAADEESDRDPETHRKDGTRSRNRAQEALQAMKTLHLNTRAARVKRKPRRKPGRILYRLGITGDELDHLITEVGPERVLVAADRLLYPRFDFIDVAE